jgi:dolichol-phosphate mannosyltransferase
MDMAGVVAVIATYNERATIGDLVNGLRLDGIRVVVVDDSTDGTAQVARQHGATVVLHRPGKWGIASAYLHGFALALEMPGVTHILQMDAGGTHRLADARAMLHRAHHGADLVIGSRFVESPDYSYGPRTTISLGAAWLMRRLNVSVRDATSGFRVWKRALLTRVLARPVKARGFAFQLELLYRAHKAGETIAEVSIPYQLTNSTFAPRMIIEALCIYGGLWRDYALHRAARV